MLDDAAEFLLRAGQETGYIFERNQWNVERVAETHESRAFHRGVDIQHAGKKRWLISDNAHRAAVEPREAHYNVLRVMLVHFEKVVIVGNGGDGFLDVVRLQRIFRH